MRRITNIHTIILFFVWDLISLTNIIIFNTSKSIREKRDGLNMNENDLLLPVKWKQICYFLKSKSTGVFMIVLILY